MRLFVAVWPSPEIVEQLEALERPSVDGLRWTTPDQWHVTMRFLGNVDAVEVPALTDALAAAPLEGRWRARLGPATAAFGRSILQVPVAELDPLAGAVVSATAAFGQPSDGKPFRGHLTLARATGRRGVDLRPLCGLPITGEWDVADVSLVESRTLPSGARYETVWRRPLVPR